MSEEPSPTEPAEDDFEGRFAAALREACKRKWGEDTWRSIQSWNQWVAENGLPLEEYLLLIDRRGRRGG